MKTDSCDYIVVGSGIAGLRGALELAQKGSVKVFCKGDPWQSNTRFAQGGIAAAMQEGDTVEFHYQDTIHAGDGLCYEPAVRVLVEEGPIRINELVAWGARFDQQGGRFIFGREGAHSHNRILHAGDATGKEIVRALLNWAQQTPGIQISCDRPALDLILQEGRCVGIYALDEKSGERTAAMARSVLLTTGGAGQIFSHTTNPPVATGDGIALAHRAGADMMDLEFYQFHPTAFHRQSAPRFLLTEALRGEGAVLKNVEGKAFMNQYHPLRDLAPRDIVSRAIVSELKKTNSSWVYLDATSIGRQKLRDRFPNIHEFLQNYELDLSVDLIPVSPSAHYWMGGVRTNLNCETSIPGLFAAGEVACNGVHGANRLASNSLLEGLVFGARAAKSMEGHLPGSLPLDREDARADLLPLIKGEAKSGLSELRSLIQKLSWEHFGLLRDETGIRAGLNALQEIPSFTPRNLEELELLNLLDCSKLMGSFALQRQESRGSHFRLDFPSSNRQLDGHHTVLRKGKLELTKILEE
ncbi:L-aspartate oxidase [bacterium]|nr:L-aspartate oxidase [bacterium]